MARPKRPIAERKCHMRNCNNPPVDVFMYRQQQVPFCADHKNLADKN